MPAAIPSGTAKNAVTIITSVEPTQAERMPACPGRRDAKCVKKSQSRRPAPFHAMSANSAAKVSTPIISAMRPRMSGRSIGFTEAFAQEMADDVAGEREQHEREARGEDGLVADRAVRQVAERHLHDVGRDGRRRFERIESQLGLHAGGGGE